MLKSMETTINYLADFFRDRNDGSSYKRLMSFVCLAVAIIKANNINNIYDVYVCALFLSSALGGSIATLFEKSMPNIPTINHREQK
ncbi:MAG: hypothetical protein GX638_02700 [Crenarchaeota archaeon]|nr:hypothetical protein [Thermoproteota archaeon]